MENPHFITLEEGNNYHLKCIISICSVNLHIPKSGKWFHNKGERKE